MSQLTAYAAESDYLRRRQGSPVTGDLNKAPALAYWGLLAFLLVLIVRPTDFVPALDGARLALLTYLGMLGGWLLSGRRTVFLHHATSKFAFLLLLVMVATTPFSYWPKLSFETTLNYVKLVALFVLLINIATTWDTIKNILWVLVGANAVHAALIVKKFVAGDLDLGRAFGEAGSIFSDPNDLALNFIMMLPLCVWLMSISRSALARMLCLALSLLFVGGIVASQSRGGLLALLGVGFLLVLNSKRKVLAVTATSVFALLIVAAAPPDAFERYSSIRDYKSDESAQSRLHLWKAGVKMWLDHPLTGVGANASPIAYGKIYLDGGAPKKEWLTLHSSPLQVTAELGTFGLLCWGGMILSGFAALREGRRCLRPRESAARGQVDPFTRLGVALQTSLLGYLAAGMFLSRAYDWLLMILLGICVAFWNLARNTARPPAGRLRASYDPRVPVGPTLNHGLGGRRN